MIEKFWNSNELGGLSDEDWKKFVRRQIAFPDGHRTACLLDAFHCYRPFRPDLVYDFLDELRSMDNAGDTPPAAYEAWGGRARAALRQYVGDEPNTTTRPN